MTRDEFLKLQARTERANARNKAPASPHPKPAKHEGALDANSEEETRSARLPFVRFILRRVSLLDVDAKWGSVKDLLDALVIAGALPGDREGQINLEVTQEKVRHFNEEETVIHLCNPQLFTQTPNARP